MLKGVKRFFVYMLMIFVIAGTLPCAVYASELPNSQIDNDWVHYNVQDVFPWAGFEYGLCKQAGKVYTENQTVISNSIPFPDFFVDEAKRHGVQGLKLSADQTMETASIFNSAVCSKANVKGPAVGGTLYDSGAKYDNLSQAAKAKKRFLLSGWVKPVENVSAVKVVMNIKKADENTVSETIINSVVMSDPTDWTNVSGVIDFGKMFNGNAASYDLPTDFPSTAESFTAEDWEISLGIVLEKSDNSSTLVAYVDDYEIIEQTKSAYATGTNLWEDPDCEGDFKNFANQGGVTNVGKDTDVKYNGNSSFKFEVNTTDTYTAQMLGRYIQLNPLKPYYYSFYVKTSEALEDAKIAMVYQQYGLTNSNAELNYAPKSQCALANVSVSNNTEWQHFSGVVLLRQYRDVTGYSSNKFTAATKTVSATDILRPEDQFVNSNVFFTVSTVPKNKQEGYSLYFDKIELRELPLHSDEPSSPICYSSSDPSAYYISFKTDRIYGLTEHYQGGKQIYDGQANAGEPLEIKSVLVGNGKSDQKATVLTALYEKDTGKIVNVVSSQALSIPIKGVLKYEHKVDIPKDFDGYIKTFVFDDLNQIKPLAKVTVFKMHAGTMSNITTNKYSNLSSDPGCELGNLKVATITKEEQHSGDKSYKVNFKENWKHAIEDNQVKFEALKTYYCSAWIKTAKPVEDFSLAFGIRHKIGGAATELTMYRPVLENTDSWQRITFKYKVDKKKVNGSEVSIESGDVLTDTMFFISAANKSTEVLPQTVYIDDIEIREVPDTTEKMYANIKEQGKIISPDQKVVLVINNLIDIWSVKSENITVNGDSVNLISVEMDEKNGVSRITISPKTSWTPNAENSVLITELKNAWGGNVSADGTLSGSFSTCATNEVVLTVKKDGTGDFKSPYLANQSITDSSKKKIYN